VGSGEALNEHIYGDPWPSTSVRLEMLDEALGVIRKLWSGKFVSHRGKYYTVEQARIYTRPETPPPIYVSGFGPKATDLAARVGDGYICTVPDPDLVQRFRTGGGGDKPCQAAFKAAYAPTEDEGAQIAYERWPNTGIPGELSQVLPSPRHFEQASQLVSPDMMKSAFVCGSNVDAHLKMIDTYAKAGFNELYIANVGPNCQGLFDMYEKEILPRVR
ncbi:MAG TPA: TIGR03557 family F420-dependent LLM class oxidoreductase, partial [Micromonosporaceae bacterium]|nr:TIGR03557 family F420-dependent LLM class oxidoreductase [Micromonosporaceae bacterium]